MDKQILSFLLKSTVIYSLAYLIVGGISYQLITKQFYVGDNPILATYLRSEAIPVEWAHTNVWLVPGLILRSFLISLVLLPFVGTLNKMTYLKFIGIIFGLIFIFTHLAAAAPSPSNIEGLIYMKPQLINIKSFLLTQPEMIIQSLVFAIGLSWVIKSPSQKISKD